MLKLRNGKLIAHSTKSANYWLDRFQRGMPVRFTISDNDMHFPDVIEQIEEMQDQYMKRQFPYTFTFRAFANRQGDVTIKLRFNSTVAKHYGTIGQEQLHDLVFENIQNFFGYHPTLNITVQAYVIDK